MIPRFLPSEHRDEGPSNTVKDTKVLFPDTFATYLLLRTSLHY
jgi:hypothetical protein